MLFVLTSSCVSLPHAPVHVPSSLRWSELKAMALFDLDVLMPAETSTGSVELLGWKESEPVIGGCPRFFDALVLGHRITGRGRMWCLLRYQRFGDSEWNRHVGPSVVPTTWAVACELAPPDYSHVILFLRRASAMPSPYPDRQCAAAGMKAVTFGLVATTWEDLTGQVPDEVELTALLLPVEHGAHY